ncbi:MAG: glycerophosphodiester phosphodiesterase family protein [Bacilli bacterium]
MLKLISHRGNDVGVNYPENSKEAIYEVLKRDYIAGVEFDVRMTRDKKIVVSHDNNIALSSNGSGLISNMKLKELERYNFGTLTNPSKIATLDDILVGINSDKQLMIEVKDESKGYRKVVNEIYKIIKKYPYLNIYICSFNDKLIQYFTKKYPMVKMGLLVGVKKNLSNSDKNFSFYSVSIINYKNYLNYDELYIWTINEKAILEDILKTTNRNLGIITDVARNLESG